MEATTILTIQTYLKAFKKEGKRVFATSSFQTQSVPLLHIIGQNFKDEITILFLDTGYLFPETYAFKNTLQKDFGINVHTLKGNRSYIQQRTKSGLMLYAESPDHCCFINKVEPMNNFLQEGDVWLSGVRKDQSKVRSQKELIEEDHLGRIRFHPMLDWTAKDVYQYIRKHNLPKHPLESEGYKSIGCIPCTQKWSFDESREGRWEGQNKTECGLHT